MTTGAAPALTPGSEPGATRADEACWPTAPSDDAAASPTAAPAQRSRWRSWWVLVPVAALSAVVIIDGPHAAPPVTPPAAEVAAGSTSRADAVGDPGVRVAPPAPVGMPHPGTRRGPAEQTPGGD